MTIKHERVDSGDGTGRGTERESLNASQLLTLLLVTRDFKLQLRSLTTVAMSAAYSIWRYSTK